MASLVFIEFDKNIINGYTKQSATLASLNSNLVIGVSDYKDEVYLNTLGEYGFDKVYMVNDFSNEDKIFNIIRDENIQTIFSSNSNNIKEISSKISINFNFPILNNVINLESINKPKTSIFSGKAEAEIQIDTDKCIFILNKNLIESKEFNKSTKVVNLVTSVNENNYLVLEKVDNKEDVSLLNAEIVVSAGRGLKGPENWEMIENLAKKLNAATACSKPVSDAGWRPHHEHVGQTGIKISPQIYFAIGISGAIQHLAGVNSSKNIIVINSDPEAPFFKSADYGIVGDAFEIVPELLKALDN